MSYRALVHNALIAAVTTSNKFFPITYHPTTGVATVGSTPSTPASVQAEETRSTFATSPHERKVFAQERDSWEWDVMVGFNVAVDASSFEEYYSAHPIKVARDATHTKQVWVTLQETNVAHPPRQDSNSGSAFRFTFNARMSPLGL